MQSQSKGHLAKKKAVHQVILTRLLWFEAKCSICSGLSFFFFEPLPPFIRRSVDRPRLTLPGCRILRAAKEQGNTDMANGTVKWFNTQKGFGFIAPDSGGKDVFVHITSLERSGLTGLADDQKVTFDIEEGRDGRESAINLALA